MLSVKFRPVIVAWLSVAAVAAVTAGAPALAGVPGSTSSINTDAQGVALGGYDPVAYFDGGKPTRGMETISASYNGARYLFASAAHRKAFLRDPKKYVPEFGGFCAVGTSFGEKVDVDPETGKVVNGKLYLNNSAKAQAIFDKDTSGTITRAEQKWPTVKDKPL
ncbi:MAG TPA: YHS domain-containing (seleno)protein [Steroidobacteraceae bacterium]|jgi:YHS domain-containing protein|nr:YHS domain-containing (seleno)protein [Steroidobacteraceae bacterium]